MRALLLLYPLIEIAALALSVHLLGFGWTLLLVVAGTVAGLLLVRNQWRRVIDGLRHAATGDIAPAGPLADGALVAIGGALLVVPGLATTVVGILLVLPPTRAVLRPLVVARAARRVAAATGRTMPSVIDGEVVDSRFEPTGLMIEAPVRHER
ncbi:FxsA family protein [Skermania piniformis]|uniref:FxsA family protein n=1 Tax=Skermania pinensis TaxID=39122 RepID=A0ABX8SEZ2_9ACTN|nr:FxsA family protein [Skermania piniformis]QXQ15497.1 FxsA family protein [Skermania piniformis]